MLKHRNEELVWCDSNVPHPLHTYIEETDTQSCFCLRYCDEFENGAKSEDGTFEFDGLAMHRDGTEEKLSCSSAIGTGSD